MSDCGGEIPEKPLNELMRSRDFPPPVIADVRYINWILTWLRGFRVKIANFPRLYCLSIPKRDLNTKKTKPNIEKWPESLGVMLEF